MRRGLLAAVLLLAGAAVVKVGSADRREAPRLAEPISPVATSLPKPETATATAGEIDPLELLRGNAACDRIAGMERLVRRYRKSLENPSDEWIRLLNLIRVSAAELWEAPHAVLSDAELAFGSGGFETVRASARDLSRVVGEYYEAARRREAASVATLRPAFEQEWASFRGQVRRSLRR